MDNAHEEEKHSTQHCWVLRKEDETLKKCILLEEWNQKLSTDNILTLYEDRKHKYPGWNKSLSTQKREALGENNGNISVQAEYYEGEGSIRWETKESKNDTLGEEQGA